MASFSNRKAESKVWIALKNQLSKSERKFTIIDIGSRGGVENHWKAFGSDLREIGFEPEKLECDRLNKIKNIGHYRRHYPLAIYDKPDANLKLNLARHLPSSSVKTPNTKILSRFHDLENLEIVRTVNVQADTLDNILKQNSEDKVDFIKVDAEGSEYEILKGAEDALGTTLGVQLEYSFLELRKGTADFCKIFNFMAKHGFELFDLSTVRLGRKALYSTSGIKPAGQVVGGHVVFLKLPPLNGELNNNLVGDIVRFASIAEVLNLPDVAAEQLEYLNSVNWLSNKQFDELKTSLRSQLPKKRLFQRFKDRVRTIPVLRSLIHKLRS